MLKTQRGNVVLYALDLFCTFTALGLIFFALYITPYMFGMHFYDVPEFVVELSVYFEQHHNLSGFAYIAAVVLPLIMAGGALLLIARLIAFYVETHEPEPGVPHVDLEEYREHKNTEYAMKKHYMKPIFFTLSLIFLVIGALVAAEYYLIFGITR